MSSTSRKAIDPGVVSSDNVENTSDIAGNATAETKAITARWLTVFAVRGSFAYSVTRKVKVTEVSIIKKTEEPEKMEGKVVCEVDVGDDMVNVSGNMHGGCAMFLIDICSTLPISALSLTQGGRGDPGVSQAINTIFHSPAPLGVRLRLVNTTLTIGGRTMSARTEIWDTTNHRLVASGVQVKMLPSTPKL